MKTVPLRGRLAAGRRALIDDQDFELVSRYSWYAQRMKPGSRILYAGGRFRVTGRRTRHVFMHTLITGYRMTDHINGDGLDNQRANLRQVTPALNNANRRPGPGRQYKGAIRYRGARRWTAYITINGQRIHLGQHDTEEEAARAYDAAARSAWGDYACLNFPEGT